jgi:hypothetical protein
MLTQKNNKMLHSKTLLINSAVTAVNFSNVQNVYKKMRSMFIFNGKKKVIQNAHPGRTLTALKIQLHSRSFLMARSYVNKRADGIVEAKSGINIHKMIDCYIIDHR